MLCRLRLVLTTLIVVYAVTEVTVIAGQPPVMLLQQPADPGSPQVGYSIMRLPDGSFAFYDRYRPESGPLVLLDRSGQPHTLQPHLPAAVLQNPEVFKSGVLSSPQVLLTPDDTVIGVRVIREDLDSAAVAEIGLRRYLNVWVQRVDPAIAHPPAMIWRGYNGSQMEYQQLRNGRLLVPFGSMQPHAEPAPPTGRHKTVIQYSDDQGNTWQQSESELIAPCYPNFNGLNEGACEPAIEQLQDGRLWMLMRTQAGFLYESYSSDNGTTSQPATASRFNTSTGPPNIMRHSNGWLVVAWNNCEMPPRANGDGVYGGRDALHIAVSDNDGRTWRGFREIYLDHRRNDNPAASGDRGTAYPLGSFTSDGHIVMLAGQGAGGRNPILIDPQWIVETQAETDFQNGLQDWSVYKHHGPAKRWWRARAVGCEIVPHPSQRDAKCLHVRRPDQLPPDGATWNFPNAWAGSLKTRVLLPKNSQGAVLCLNDRMFDPANDHGEEFAVFQMELRADSASGRPLAIDQWNDVELTWDLSKAPQCHVRVNGQNIGTSPVRHPTLNGISYVRFRSSATTPDTAGLLVDSVRVQCMDPEAPECSDMQRQQHELRYVQRVVPTWSEAP